MMLQLVILTVGVGVTIEAASMNDGLFFMECKARYNAPDSDLILMKDRKLPETKQGKCMMACLLKKMKFLRNNGSLDMAKVEQWLNDKYKNDAKKRQMAVAVVNECSQKIPKKGTSDCEATVQLLDCAKAKAAQMKQTSG